MNPASSIRNLALQPAIDRAMNEFHERLEDGLALAREIQQIPAPTFCEIERARRVREYFDRLDLRDVELDDLGNVYGRMIGSHRSRPPLVLSAHLDTVFPMETDLSTRRSGTRLAGPGMADNSMGVAGVIWLLEVLVRHGLRPARDIWFVANVGEEGLGDLNGMRAVVDRFQTEATYIILEGGSFGHVIHRGIGVRRFRVTIKASGGHSWADFGHASAIHTLGHVIAAIDQIAVPIQPKTTYNVGVVEGGTSINSIAESASCLLDLRSEKEEALQTLMEQVKEILQRFSQKRQVKITLEKIGDRPAGGIPADHPLVMDAREALHAVGRRKIEFGASSTDANIPLSRGAAAVCIGLAESGNVHRLNEYLDFAHLSRGMGQLLLLAAKTAGLAAGENAPD